MWSYKDLDNVLCNFTFVRYTSYNQLSVMKKLILPLILCLIVNSANAQNYELKSKTKQQELFTTSMIDSIEATVSALQHPTETVYYNWSEYTTLVIYPKTAAIRKEGEE